jgi:spore germination cell wall hydrolase CwlJ-like protein
VANRTPGDPPSDPRFPATVCAVIQQGGEMVRHRCQFSWWCDGRSDRPLDRRSWEAAKTIARTVYWGLSEDPTRGALWYHADYVAPYWSKAFEEGPIIGRHIFYLEREHPVQLVRR